MDVVLRGTAGPEGFPVAGCRCARCSEARHLGVHRRPARLAVGETVLDGAHARDLRTPDGLHVLWAPGPEPLADSMLGALAGTVLDCAVLGTTPELTVAAHQLARLRRCGAVGADADVVLTGIGHEHPPVQALHGRAAAWGARVADDDTALGVPTTAPPQPRRTLVLGPAASGKSAFAEDLLAAEAEVRYLATGPVPNPCDRDWTARVEAHRARRPGWWRTIETPDAAAQLGLDGPPVLLDSVGTWLAFALQRAGAWDGAEGWAERLHADVDGLLAGWRQLPGRVVAVSEEVGWGVVPGSRSGRVFRDTLGRLNQRLAAQSERVVLVVAGRSVELSAGVGWA